MTQQLNDCLFQLEDLELYCSELLNQKKEAGEAFQSKLQELARQRNLNRSLSQLLAFYQGHQLVSSRVCEPRRGYVSSLLLVSCSPRPPPR